MLGLVKRYCDGCRRQHDIDAFDLEGDESGSVCRAHVLSRVQVAEVAERKERQEKIAALERKRRSLIAALVKIDAEIADLRGVARSSSPFTRVEPSDVFGGDSDGDAGFGD